MGQIWVVRFTIRHGTRIFQPCAHLCNTPLCKREVGRVMHIFHELATFRDTAEYGPSANVSARPSPAARKDLIFYDFSVTISGKKRNENRKTLEPLHERLRNGIFTLALVFSNSSGKPVRSIMTAQGDFDRSNLYLEIEIIRAGFNSKVLSSTRLINYNGLIFLRRMQI